MRCIKCVFWCGTVGVVALIALLFLMQSSTAQASDWTYWRGPEQTGISRETNLADTFDYKTKKNVAWIKDFGGRATPILHRGRLYLNCRTMHDVNDPKDKIHARERVVCLNLENGEIIWDDYMPVFFTDIAIPRVGWASMCADEETGYVYMHSVSGRIRCYDMDGKVIWEHSALEQFGKISGYGGRTISPIIDEDRLIVSWIGANWGEFKGPVPSHYFYAFNKKTGAVEYVAPVGGRPLDTLQACPIIKNVDGKRILFSGNADGGIHAIQARTGKYLWGMPLSHRAIMDTPTISEDGKYIYISQGEDNLDNTEFGRIQCIEAATGKPVWRVDGMKAGFPSPLEKDGILYVILDTGLFVALDSKTGDLLWRIPVGTVGKSSPVWADGKLYITEVNGNIWILRPSREKCEVLCHQQILATTSLGMDEIYASPAISNGKIVFVTRDHIICVSDPDKKPTIGTPPAPAPEAPAEKEIAQMQLLPFEDILTAGESIEFSVKTYDKDGRLIGTEVPVLTGVTVEGAKIEGNKVITAQSNKHLAGYVTYKKGEVEAKARLRVLPPLPWKWDFEGYTDKMVPPTWVRAFMKYQPVELDGSTVLKYNAAGGMPSHYIWFGSPQLNDYTIQADVKSTELRKQIANVGIANSRYILVLEGNTQQLRLYSWPAHLHNAKCISYPSDVVNKWYTLKLNVTVKDGKAYCKGKAWVRGEPEPKEWMVGIVDPHANPHGSPGLYVYALSSCFFDNVSVTPATDAERITDGVENIGVHVEGVGQILQARATSGSGEMLEAKPVSIPKGYKEIDGDWVAENGWPQWGGSPHRNMTSRETGISIDFDGGGKGGEKNQKNILWSAKVGSQAYGNPVTGNGKIFVGTNNVGEYRPKHKGDRGVLLAFEEKTGKFLWQLTREKLPEGRVKDWPLMGICSVPVIEGNRMWVVTNRCEIMCLDTEGFYDGKNDGPITDEVDNEKEDADIIWSLDLIAKYGVFPHNLATSSPTVYGDYVFVMTSNGVDEAHLVIPCPTAPSFICVNKNTGEVVWHDNTPGDHILHGQWSSPCVGIVNGRPQVIFAGGTGWVYALDADTGEHLWRFDLNPKDSKYELGGRGTRNYIVATPVFKDNSVVIASGQDPEHGEGVGHIFRIDATKRGDITETGKIWHLGGTDEAGELIFRRTLSTVAIYKDLVYAPDLSGFVHCIDFQTGKRYWEHDLESAIWGSAFAADDKVFVGDEDGFLHILQAGKELKPLKKVEFNGSVYGTPIISNGVMFLNDRSRLYAIKIKD